MTNRSNLRRLLATLHSWTSETDGLRRHAMRDGEVLLVEYRTAYLPDLVAHCPRHMVDNYRLTGAPEEYEGLQALVRVLSWACAHGVDVRRCRLLRPWAQDERDRDGFVEVARPADVPRQADQVVAWRLHGCTTAAVTWTNGQGKVKATVAGRKRSLDLVEVLAELDGWDGSIEVKVLDLGTLDRPARRDTRKLSRTIDWAR